MVETRKRVFRVLNILTPLSLNKCHNHYSVYFVLADVIKHTTIHIRHCSLGSLPKKGRERGKERERNKED